MPKKKVNKKPASKRVIVRQHAAAHTSHLRQIISTSTFGHLYATGAVLILLTTTLFWSLLSTRIQMANADQLVNIYLFENAQSFHNASLPAAHSFLMKWPLFWLTHLYGATDQAFMIFTLITVVVTVAILAVILYVLEHRLLLFGTLCLALASTLLLIPAQPYPGALLPVNMAMMATRNLEYVLYVASVALFIRAPRLKSWNYWIATVLLSLLVTSDRLFLTLSIGGALMALVIYAIFKRIEYVKLAARWLLMSLIAGTTATAALYLLDTANIVHIIGQAAAGPYGFTHDLRQLTLGIIFAGFGLLTNFGANLADGVTNFHDTPRLAYQHLTSPGGLAYLVNIAVFAAGLVATSKLLMASLLKNLKYKKQSAELSQHLSLIMIWTGLASLVVFILSDHYYPVDARYLTIIFFAVFIAMATYTAQRKWQPEKLMLVGFGLLISCIIGLAASAQSYTASLSAMATIKDRDQTIARALSHHPVATLLGDYWRVLPIKQLAGPKANIQVTPYGNCLERRSILSSTSWQVNLQKNSFAYLLSLDQHSPDFPQCDAAQVIAKYGRPNSSVLIAGTHEKPQELLLFYDRGTNNFTDIKNESSAVNTLLPVDPKQLPNTQCATSTVMNIVAHQDDDLLFLSPDLLRSVKAGECIRTVYMTAGDAGSDRLYWLSREQGSKAAYDLMDGTEKDIWIDRIAKLGPNQFATISSPIGHPNISLIFLRLPDGNLNGSGFKAFDHQSLGRLQANDVATMESVDRQSTYDAGQLTSALASLMDVYSPVEVRTQSPLNMSDVYADHSDHLAVGHFATQAYAQYRDRAASRLRYYVGYPIRQWEQNVDDQELLEKQAAFFAYGQFDGSVCRTVEICSRTPTYHAYLGRQYEYDAE